jgi:glycosyltransferase 2 family protein
VTLATFGSKRGPAWSLVVSLAFSGILLFLAVRGVDWTQVLETLRRGRVDLLALSCLILTISYVVRGQRWRLVLSAERRIASMTVFSATMAGYLGNSVLPARAGELLRSVLLGRRAGLSTSYVLATALLERLADVVALVILGLVALLVLSTAPDWLLNAAAIVGMIALAGLAVTRFLPHIDRRPIGPLARLPVPVPLRTWFIAVSSQFVLGLSALRNSGRGWYFAALTALIWMLDVTFAVTVGRAFDLPLFVPQAMLLLAALGLASAVPSTPGYVGVYQFVAVTVLVPIGFFRDQALALVIGLQGVVFGVEIVWGTLGLWYLSGPRGSSSGLRLASSAPESVD